MISPCRVLGILFYNEIKAPIDVEAVRKFPLKRSSRKDQNTPLGNSRPQDWRFPGTPIIVWGCLSWHPGEEAERGWFSVLTDRLGPCDQFSTAYVPSHNATGLNHVQVSYMDTEGKWGGSP